MCSLLNRAKCLVVAAFVATLAQTGMAAVVFQYGGVPAGSGQSVSVPIYLMEVSQTGLLTAANENGLSDAGVKVTRQNGNATIMAAAPNQAFADSSTVGLFSDEAASLSLHTAFTATSGVLPDASGRVLLGTLTVAAGTQTSTFSVSAFGTPHFTLTYASIYNLDDDATVSEEYQAAAGSTFAITAVPEPTIACISAAASAGLLTRRRRQ